MNLPLLRRALAVGMALAAAGCSHLRVDNAARAAAGFASHTLCDDIFITGRDPDTAFAERVQPLAGMGLVSWAMRRSVDRERREVTVSIGEAFVSKARWREGLGCLALPAAEADAQPELATAAPSTVQAPDPWGPAVVHGSNPRLQAALERALNDVAGSQPHRTKALLVLHDGQLIAERYAPGFGVDTPVLGFSATKSVTNALLGILVRQGKLKLDQPAPLPAWADPADPRNAITVEQLLRQTSGLHLPQDNSGFDFNAQLMYTVRDKAGVTAAQPLEVPPGTRWAYTDGNFVLLSRIVRDAVGGRAEDVRRFAQAELFGPLGLRQVTLDVDATGTPIGASHLSASARDWARFGQLYLDDGMRAGRRILPEGWVQWSATPTLNTGYGAGWWTNRKPGLVPRWGVLWGLPSAPPDAFFARGFMGQFVVVIPSRRLVLVRLSVSHHQGDDIAETDRIVGEVLAALPLP